MRRRDRRRSPRRGRGAARIWTFSPWPLASRAEFARTVVGVAEDDLPTPELTAAVEVALGAAAYVTAARADLVPQVRPRRLVRHGVWGVAGVLLLRGAAGLVSSGLTSRPTDFTRWDLALYSPLCLALGGRWHAWLSALATLATKTGDTQAIKRSKDRRN